jgi:FkbM family methyltransferase
MSERIDLASTMRRPWRRLRRLCRVLGGRDLWCQPEVKIPAERLGSDYGGWTISPRLLDSNSVVYSFGVGQDISFDLSVIARFGCTVHAFDPTPRSIDWLHRQTLPAKFQFHEYGLGNVDGLVRFVPPADARHTSYSMAAASSAPEKAESFPVRRLATITADLGHDAIDLLKMDIEGAEYDALDDILNAGLRIGQLLVEFHHRLQREQVARSRQSIARLRDAGYRVFDVAPSGEEYSFVHEDALASTLNSAHEQHASTQ